MSFEQDVLDDLDEFFGDSVADILGDLDLFLDSGEKATYNGSEFNVQFFQNFEAFIVFLRNTSVKMNVEDYNAFLIAKTSDLPGIAHGNRVVVGVPEAETPEAGFQDTEDTVFVTTVDTEWEKTGQFIYYVRGVQPDATGLTVLLLGYQ